MMGTTMGMMGTAMGMMGTIGAFTSSSSKKKNRGMMVICGSLKNQYRTLKIKPGASESEVRKAFRQLAEESESFIFDAPLAFFLERKSRPTMTWTVLMQAFLCVLFGYCECFASGVYCDGCNCVNCCNNVENESARYEAVEATLECNPNAFRPKICNSPHASKDSKESFLQSTLEF